MSYDVSLVADLGAGPVRVTWLDANYTYNCGRMLVEATGGTSLGDMDGWEARTVARTLRDALVTMERERPKYLGMNPENNWGDLDGWMNFLRTIADSCEMAPDASLSVR